MSYEEPIVDIWKYDIFLQPEIRSYWRHALGEYPWSCCKTKRKPFELRWRWWSDDVCCRRKLEEMNAVAVVDDGQYPGTCSNGLPGRSRTMRLSTWWLKETERGALAPSSTVLLKLLLLLCR
ncbi:uncharacterized protein LOC140704905 [Pogona vitticeps]